MDAHPVPIQHLVRTSNDNFGCFWEVIGVTMRQHMILIQPHLKATVCGLVNFDYFGAPYS